MTALAEKARTLLNAAYIVNEYGTGDPEVAARIRDLVAVIVGRDPGDRWPDVLEVAARIDRIEVEVPYQYRQAETSIAERDLAEVLYRLIHHPDMRPCPTCLDSRPGKPWEVAAASEPAWPTWGGFCGYHRKAVAS